MGRKQLRRKGHGRRSATRGGGTFVDAVIGITGFLPASVAQGSGTVSPLQVLGFGFTLTTEVHFNGALIPSTYSSSTVMAITVQGSTVLVPGYYPVFVTDVFYPATSTTKVWGVNYPVPTLASLSPVFAYLGAASAAVTTTGTGYFTAGTDALVNGVNRAWSYGSATTGTLTIPGVDLLAAGTLSVVIVNPEPGGGTSVARTFSVRYRAPAITAVSASVIPINSGDYPLTLTDSGGGYYNPPAWPDGGTVGTVDGVPVATTWISPTQVVLTIPAAVTSVAGVKAIRVVNPTVGGGGGTSAPTNVSVSAPTTTGLSFASRVRGFDPYVLRVSGTNLTASDTVHYRGAPLSTTYASPTALDGLLGADVLAVAGAGDVTVVTATGYETNAQVFTVIDWQYMSVGATLRGYYPASTLVDDGTGRASQWSEAVTGVRNPIQTDPTKRPNIIASVPALNGKPAAYFDGSRGDFLEMEQWIVSTTTGLITKTDFNVWVVGSAIGAAQVSVNITLLGDGSTLGIARLSTGAIAVLDDAGGSVSPSVAFHWLDGAAFVARVRKTGGSIYIRVNNGAEASAVHGSPVLFNPGDVLVGRASPVSGQYAGYIGAIVACDSNLNWTHQTQIDNLLAADFATSFGTVTGTLVPTVVAPNTGTQFEIPFEITVTVPGGGAVTGDVVNVDGYVLETIVDTPTTLRGMLTAASLFTSGIKGVTVSNAGGIGPPVALTIAPFVPGIGPNLTSVTPNACVRCDDPFPIVCAGTNFTASSVVWADSTPLPTSFDGVGQLTATVTDPILFASGNKAITVHDPAGTSGTQILTVAPWTLNSVPEIGGWWEADDVNTTGSAVTQINDKTGLLRHAVQATGAKQPLLIAANPNFNGQPSIDFNGTNHDMVVPSVTVTGLMGVGTVFYFVTCYRADTITTSGGLTTPYANQSIVSLDGSGYFGIVTHTGPSLWGYTGDGSYKVVQNNALLVATTQYAVYRKAAGTLFLSINGGVEQTFAPVGGTPWSSQHLSFGSGLASNYFNGQAALWAAFTATPSAANQTRIKNYTRIKYGWTP